MHRGQKRSRERPVLSRCQEQRPGVLADLLLLRDLAVLAEADVAHVKAHRQTLGPRAEAPDPGVLELADDGGHGDSVLVQVVDELEEVVLGLVHVELVLVVGKDDLAEEVHLVLLLIRVLRIVRLRAAHHVVRTREHVSQLGRDGNFEVTDRYTAVLLQCEPQFSTVSD